MSPNMQKESGGDDPTPALVPKLRFPEFRGSKGWQSGQLKDSLSSISNGLALDQGSEILGYRVTRIETISAGTIDLAKVGLIQTSEDISAYKLRVGDILLSNINSVAHIGKSVFVDRDYDLYHGMNLLRLEVNRTQHDPKFISYAINTDGIRASLRERANKAVNQASINQTELGKTEVSLPLIPEQQRIADCLGSLDELVAAQARKVEALKAHKKGLMQQLFPQEGETQPRLRFPEFQDAGEWEARQFEDFVAKSFYGTSSSTSPTGQYPVLRMGNMADGGLDFTNLVYIDLEPDSFELFRLEDGDILLNRTNSPALVGKISIFRLKSECITASYIVSYRLIKERIVPLFCNLMLNTPLHQAKVKALAKPSVSQANINPTTFKKELIVAVPSLAEQQRIADCLTSLDDLITAESNKVTALKTHKKGLMQQLFPTPAEVEA
jgi:type I restriction enzyme S subunit